MVDNNTKTGNGRRSFMYEKEMENIFGKKRNVHLELLLDGSAINMPIITPQKEKTCTEGNILGVMEKEALATGSQEGEDTESGLSNSQYISTAKASFKRVKQRLHSKQDTLELLHGYIGNYYDELIKIQQQKLLLQKERLEA
nr:unnamed protein product [Callosobruchus analis]CAI5848058.1 unnamed protein product [Callosobruchus analis]